MSSDTSPTDPLEAMRHLWASAGASLAPLAAVPLDAEALTRKLDELRAVEGWLTLNLETLRAAIRGLELQRAALESWKPAGGPGSTASAPARSAAPASGASMPPAPWDFMRQWLLAASNAVPDKDGGGERR